MAPVGSSMSCKVRCPLVLPLCLAATLALAVGCRNLHGEPMPGSIRELPLCVERHRKDSRNLAKQIAEALRAEGVYAISARPKHCPDDAPYKVTYLDNWSWDLRMFLAKLTVEVVDSTTGEIVAYGESTQDSLGAMGMTHRLVIERAVSALLGSE